MQVSGEYAFQVTPTPLKRIVIDETNHRIRHNCSVDMALIRFTSAFFKDLSQARPRSYLQ
jgi:hypothetical protein